MQVISKLTTAVFATATLSSAQLITQLSKQHPIESCNSRSIFDAIPASGFEPSDASWDAKSKTLYVIDDNGRLAAIPGHHLTDAISDNTDQEVLMSSSTDVKVWTVSEKGDMEGCAVDHRYPEIVYLGVESPAQIVPFNVTSGATQNWWNVQESFDTKSLDLSPTELKKLARKKPGNSGLESLVFLPPVSEGGRDRLAAGRQSDARVFIFEIAEDRNSLEFVGSVKPPGPGRDLAAMSLFLGEIYFVYDKEFEAVSVPLKKFDANIKAAVESTEGSWVPRVRRDMDDKVHRDHHKRAGLLTAGRRKKGKKWGATEFEFDIRGQEGLAFAYSDFSCAVSEEACEDIEETPVVYAIDPPKRKDFHKDVLVGTYSQLMECFQK